MRTVGSQKGFTLVELSIVMIITGILLAGALKGTELIENERVVATIAQVKIIANATTVFGSKFGYYPGDMPNADQKLAGCNADCAPAAPPLSNNGAVGPLGWAESGWANQTTMSYPPSAETDETTLFWVHLLQAEIITGVSSAALSAPFSPAWGSTHPAAKIGGGFVVGSSDGTLPLPGSAVNAPRGLLLVILPTPTSALGTLSAAAAAGRNPLLPQRAAQIDRKMDDGGPASGYVQAYGIGTSCYSTAAPFTAAIPGYLESVGGKDCGLVFRIQ